MITRTGRRILITFPQRLLERYASGELNHDDVARIVRVSADVVLRELRRAGMNTSRSGRKRLLSARRLGLKSLDETVTQLYGECLSLRQIARRLGMTQEGIRQVLLRNGKPLRSRGARSPVMNGSGKNTGRKRFAGRLRRLRRTAGLTRTELAARSGLTRATIWSLEKGLRLPIWTTLLKLSKALGVSLQALGVHAIPPDPSVLVSSK